MADIVTDFILRGKDETHSAFGSATASARSMGREIDNLRGTFSAFTAVASSLGLTQFFASAVAEAEKAERASRRLDAVLAATGRETVPGLRAELDRMAESMAGATLFDDDEIRGVQAELLKFGNIGTETFQRVLRAGADLATFNGTSLAPAVEAVGRALANPVQGLKQLESQIGKLTPRQKEHIDRLIEQNDLYGAQAAILDLLEGKIGGVSDRINTGMTRALADFKEAWSELTETIGKTAPAQTTVEVVLGRITTKMLELRDAVESGSWLRILATLTGLKDWAELIQPDTSNRRAQGQIKPPPATGGADAFLTEEQLERRRREAEKAHQEEVKRRMELAALIEESRGQQLMALAETLEAQRQADEERVDSAQKAELELQAMIDESNQQQLAAIAETMAARDAADTAYRDKLMAASAALFDSLRTEQEIVEEDFAQKMLLLKEYLAEVEMQATVRYENGLLDEETYQQQLTQVQARYFDAALRLSREKEAAISEAELAEKRRRLGQSQVFDRMSLESSRFFLGQMSLLMQTENEKLFRIGKVFAIADATVNTYQMAVKAYQALAGIPIVGPALGAAAAAAATVFGLAQIQAIRSAEPGAGAATGVFAANPITGFPTESPPALLPSPGQGTAELAQTVNITLQGSGFTDEDIRELIEQINEQLGDRVTLNVN